MEDRQIPAFRASVGAADVTVVLLGTGALNLGALTWSLSGVLPNIAVVAGLAGGLKSEQGTGDILVARSVCGEDLSPGLESDELLVQAAVAAGAKQVGRFLSVARILRTPEEKSRFSPLADVLEMESLKAMNELMLRGVPAVAIRAIADPVHLALPCDFEAALDERGEIRVSSVLAQVVWAPKQWSRMISFAMNSYRATVNLARLLDRYVQLLAAQKGFEKCQVQVA